MKVHGLGESCNPFNAGTANRTDNCATGLVCLDGNSAKTTQCFKRCSVSADCDGAACETRRIEAATTATAKVCALPPAVCDPIVNAGQCPNDANCYLTTATQTTCETTSGEGDRTTSCTYSRDCLPSLTCATQGQGARHCYPTCSVASPHCPSSSTFCQPTTAGATYSYCY